jgi:hypothetical protein
MNALWCPNRRVESGAGKWEPQISPLRYAPVEMTNLLYKTELSSRPEESWACGPPKLMKTTSIQQLRSLEAPSSPFVISTEAQRSGEISVWMLPPGNVFRPERTRISCYSALERTTCAAFIKESRMDFASATNLDRKSGVAEWRDLRFSQSCAALQKAALFFTVLNR